MIAVIPRAKPEGSFRPQERSLPSASLRAGAALGMTVLDGRLNLMRHWRRGDRADALVGGGCAKDQRIARVT